MKIVNVVVELSYNASGHFYLLPGIASTPHTIDKREKEYERYKEDKEQEHVAERSLCNYFVNERIKNVITFKKTDHHGLMICHIPPDRAVPDRKNKYSSGQ